MAPVQAVGDFPGIPGPSILDLMNATLSSSSSSSSSSSPSPSQDINLHARSEPSPAADHGKTLIARADSTSTSSSGSSKYGQGTVAPSSIHMGGLMALFAIIGFAFVAAAIWFFFWAKNGGFVWRKGDWEDYKSTVLRRKGPDGRTLSNATKSTKLGGGSIVGKGYSDDGYTYTDSGMGYTDTATTVTEKGEPKRKRRFKDRFRRNRNDDEGWERGTNIDEDVRAYREEKPARVGGMNREAEGTYHGSDYDLSNPASTYNQSEMSQVRDYAYHAPPRAKSHRQSRNFSFVPGTEDVLSQVTGDSGESRESQERAARRHNRRRERRRNPPPPTSSSRQSSPRKRERRSHGHYTEPLDFSSAGTRSEYQYSNVETDDGSGTKSYHHPIPGLSKGYRREGRRHRRRDSLSDSDGDETRYS